MDINDILKVDSTNQLMIDDVNVMQDLLNQGMRAEAYLYYLQRIGPNADATTIITSQA